MPDIDRLAAPLEQTMREAGALARKTGSGEFKRWTKGEDNSPVSDADIAVNDFLRGRLAALAPDAGWLSEETDDDRKRESHSRVWIVDPIDGTRAFLAGRDDWSISVALVEDGRPVLAALYAPVTNEMFVAVRDKGTRFNGAAMRASSGKKLDNARVAGPKRYLDALAGFGAPIAPQPRIHSLALRLVRVGHGVLDAAFASTGSHDWDIAAADLLVHEAGGALTDFTGATVTFNQADITHGALIAAGKARHAALLDILRDRQGEFA